MSEAMHAAQSPLGRQYVGSEVAVFVDFENIRYSTINSFGREPDPLVWRDKALKYGLMAVARAYADFDQHPSTVRMRLDVAGFEAQHYPAKRTTDQHGREKMVSRSDLNFVVDISIPRWCGRISTFSSSSPVTRILSAWSQACGIDWAAGW